MFQRSKVLCECGDIEEEIAYNSSNIRISSDPTLNGDDYIVKVYKYDNEGKFSGVCRISMKDSSYIDCDCQNDILTQEELKEFISALNSPRVSKPIFYKDDEYPFNVWQKLIVDSNRLYEDEEIEKRIPDNLAIPDYSSLPIAK